MAYVNNNTRPLIHQQLPPVEAPKSGWLKRAIGAVIEAVQGPQMAPARTQGVDTYSASGKAEINRPRTLAKLCNTGKGGGSKVLTAISNEYYLQLCDEIGNYSDGPAPARPVAQSRQVPNS